jgi:hypothetical protein
LDDAFGLRVTPPPASAQGAPAPSSTPSFAGPSPPQPPASAPKQAHNTNHCAQVMIFARQALSAARGGPMSISALRKDATGDRHRDPRMLLWLFSQGVTAARSSNEHRVFRIADNGDAVQRFYR